MSDYKRSQAKLVAHEVMSDFASQFISSLDPESRLDVCLANSDRAFEHWDNIASKIYEERGGKYEDGIKYAKDENLFEECQNDATLLVLEVINATK